MNEKTQEVVIWSDGNKDGWSFQRESLLSYSFLFQLTHLPDFSEPRFKYLGEKQEDRKTEMARRQIQTLRQLHSLGNHSGISLRFRRLGNKVLCGTLIRISTKTQKSHSELEQLSKRIRGMFPKEYSLKKIEGADSSQVRNSLTDISWAHYCEEIFKPEDTYRGNTWPYFYVASLWQPQQTNDMESLCRSLLSYDGEALVEVLLLPAFQGAEEREWVDLCTQRMWEAQSGEKIYSEGGTVQKSYDAIRGLRVPLENYEEWIRRYDQNRLFLYSIRVLTSDEPSGLTQSLIATSSRSHPQIVRTDSSQPIFPHIIKAVSLVDLLPENKTRLWIDTTLSKKPFKVQRLHRLADIDELSAFWRLPIAVRPDYPGFDLDTGRATKDELKSGVLSLKLGSFVDDVVKDDLDARINRESLSKHGLIVGSPGSGKTTTVFSILQQLWSDSPQDQRIPFMVLEPAKTEYRALKQIEPFKGDLWVFTLGDENISPFRFNPLEVLPGITMESHISRLNACFMGAFDLFSPLPLLLDKALRQTYEKRGWLFDSKGGEPGLEIPTLSDLYTEATLVAEEAGYSGEVRDNIHAALLQRLDSLRRGSKGRMLDTKVSVPFAWLMERPVIFELDGMNEEEKALLMMFLLTFVFEYTKANCLSGSPLRHLLVLEEAHNLIGRGDAHKIADRANPKEHAIRLFIRMLAEMRALGEGILIADQLPSALAPEAVKQTNLKILMRLTSSDDRAEIGSTMDLGEEHVKQITRFKSGQAYIFLEEWDRVREVKMMNFKKEYELDIPPDDETIKEKMKEFEHDHPNYYRPFSECTLACTVCNHQVRNLAERYSKLMISSGDEYSLEDMVNDENPDYHSACIGFQTMLARMKIRMNPTHQSNNPVFPFCTYLHLLKMAPDLFRLCQKHLEHCECKSSGHAHVYELLLTKNKVNKIMGGQDE